MTGRERFTFISPRLPFFVFKSFRKMNGLIVKLVFIGIVGCTAASEIVRAARGLQKGHEWIEIAPWYQCTANGAFEHEEKCEYFYDCYNGEAWLGRCTENQLFDLRYSGCNFPAQTRCQDRTRPEGSGPEPFPCATPNGNHADPERCDKYVVCINDNPYHYVCTTGTLFSVELAECTLAQNVDCGDRPLP